MDSQEAELKFGTGDAVRAMAIARGGRVLAVGGKSTHVVVYAIRTPGSDALAPMVWSSREAPSERAPCAEITEIGRVAPTGSTKEVGSNTVLSVALSADGTMLCAGGEAKLVQLWSLHNVVDGEGWCRPSAPQEGKDTLACFRCNSIIHSLSLTARGDHLAVGLSDCVEVYQIERADEVDPETGGALHAVMCQPLLWLDCSAQQGGVAFSKAEGRLAIAGNQLVTVYDIVSGGTLCKMPRSTGTDRTFARPD